MKEPLYTTVSFSYDSIQKGQTRAFLPELKGLPAYAQVVRIDSIKVKKY